MKKSILFLLMSVLFLGLVGCTGETTTESSVTTDESTTETPTTTALPTTEMTFASSVTIDVGDEQIIIGFEDSQNQTLFELIESADIYLDYLSTDYGPMVIGIGDLRQDDFHWIGFTKNDAYATNGLDTIAYEDGDVFTFSENLVSWETTLSAELIAIEDDYLVFENQNQSFHVTLGDLPVSVNTEDLVIGFIYQMTGLVDESTDETINVFNPSSFELDVIDDFTELYVLEEGDVFILSFTVTYVEDSLGFGTEIFAEDINGLASTEISDQMSEASVTDYIFYTIPDAYELMVGETYVGRFIYQVNEPSTIPQITLYEENINGENLTDVIIQP